MQNTFRLYKKKLLFIVFGIIAIIASANYFYYHKKANQQQASDLYYSLNEAVKQQDHSKALAIGEQLMTYKKTPYAQLASLMLAKIAIEQNDYTQAEDRLRWVTKNCTKKDITFYIAKARLARVLFESGKKEAALAEVAEDSEDYRALFAEIKGDIYLSQGNVEQAKNNYLLAKQELPKSLQSPLLYLKLMDLGVLDNV